MTNLYGMLMGSGLFALQVNCDGRSTFDTAFTLAQRNFHPGFSAATQREVLTNSLTNRASSIMTLFNTESGDFGHVLDVLLSAQVGVQAACSDKNADVNDADFCEPRDQIENNKDIAKSTLRLLSVTIPFRRMSMEEFKMNDADDQKKLDLRYRTTAPRVGAHDGQTVGIHERFDLWHRMAQNYLESKNQQNLEDGVDIPERTNTDQYFPADWEDIVEFFELLYSSPDEDSNFERFMILYDKLLDLVFSRYFAIAKSEDGDGSDETWNGLTEVKAGEGFTFHLFMASA